MASTTVFNVSGVKMLYAQVDGTKPKPTTIRVLLPHEILDSLADHLGVFSSLMLGNTDSGSRLKFWNHVRRLKPWASHPALDENSGVPLQDLIPLTLHGDGAEMYTDDEVFVWSIASAFGGTGMITDVLLYKFPFALIPERFMRSDAAPCHD